jgi:hypothetical protein
MFEPGPCYKSEFFYYSFRFFSLPSVFDFHTWKLDTSFALVLTYLFSPFSLLFISSGLSMSSKTSAALASPIHPPVGTLIDGGSLELVKILGVGGYGVVYRAVDTRGDPRHARSQILRRQALVSWNHPP